MVNTSAKTPFLVRSRRFGYYEFIIFCFLIFEFLIMNFGRVVDTNSLTSYLTTYEYGFLSKSLMGTILFLFTDYLTIQAIYRISTVSFVLLLFLISLFLGKLLRSSPPDLSPSSAVFCVLFLSSPLSVTYLLGMYIGRIDTYWIILVLVSLYLSRRSLSCLIVPLLCAVAMGIHPGFVFAYFPAIAIALLYEIPHNKYSNKHIFVFLSCCISVAFLFYLFQIRSAVPPFESAVAFAEHLSKYSDFKPSALFLHIQYFTPFSESYYGYIRPLLVSYATPLVFALTAFSLPLLITFGLIWKHSIKNTDSKFLKLVFIICSLAPFVFVPITFLLNDLERYWAAVINTQFLLIFYFLFSGESAVVLSVKRVGTYLIGHPFVLICIIVFFCSLKFSETTTNIFSFIKDTETVAQILEKYTTESVFGIS